MACASPLMTEWQGCVLRNCEGKLKKLLRKFPGDWYNLASRIEIVKIVFFVFVFLEKGEVIFSIKWELFFNKKEELFFVGEDWSSSPPPSFILPNPIVKIPIIITPNFIRSNTHTFLVERAQFRNNCNFITIPKTNTRFPKETLQNPF